MIAFAIGKAISAPLSFILVLMLAAVMSREEYASYVATIAVLEIGIVLGTLGVEWVMQTTLASIRVHGNASQLRHAVLLLGTLPAVPYMLIAGVLWQLAPQVASALGGVATTEVLRLYAVVLALEGPTRLLRDSLMAVLLLQRTAQVSQILRVLVVFVIVGLEILSDSPVSAAVVARAEIAAAAVSMGTVLVALGYFLVREWPRSRQDESLGRWLGWHSVRFAGHAYGSLVMMLLIGTDVMTALVARYLGADATATFGFVVRLVETARRYLPMDLFWGVLRPAAIGRYEDNGHDVAQLMRDCNRMVEANLLVVGAGLAVAIAAGDELVAFLSRGSVQSPLLLLAALIPILATHTVRRTVELIAYVRKRSVVFVRAALASLLAPPLAVLLLGVVGSAHGAAAAVLLADLAFISLAVLGLRFAGEKVVFHLDRWLRQAGATLLAGVIGFAVNLAVVGLLGTWLACAAALLSYAALVAALGGVAREDFSWLTAVVRRRMQA
jgi:O-antigen/teichoic acid export membrane protein